MFFQNNFKFYFIIFIIFFLNKIKIISLYKINKKMLKVGTDCSGIEAPLFALDALKKKYNHIFSCEINKHSKESIIANKKPKIFYNDLLKRDNSKTPYVDFYICGFPCQTFSTQGLRLGFNDPRGTVFFKCYEYIKIQKPKIFVLENVKGLVNHDKGNTFKTIKKYLKRLKIYDVKYFLMNTKDYGIPQNRERIFIIGRKKRYIKNELKKPKPFPLKKYILDVIKLSGENITKKTHPELFYLAPAEKSLEKKNKLKKKFKVKNLKKHNIVVDLGASLKFMSAALNISPTLKASRSNYFITSLNRKLSPQEALLLQGFPKTFKIVVSNNQIYKQIGNSMSVNVLCYLFKAIFKSIK